MFNCFYSLSRFRSDLCDLFICTFVAYFVKLFWILNLEINTRIVYVVLNILYMTSPVIGKIRESDKVNSGKRK